MQLKTMQTKWHDLPRQIVAKSHVSVSLAIFNVDVKIFAWKWWLSYLIKDDKPQLFWAETNNSPLQI